MAEEDPQFHARAKRESHSGVNLNEEVQRGSVVPSDRKHNCSQKAALLAEVQAAMGALMAIHNDEVAALFREDFDTISELRTKLQVARNQKASLIELYQEHVTSHGC